MKKICILMISMMAFHLAIFAQLTGTKTIPGDYPTVGAAVSVLNSLGVGSGGVTFLISDGAILSETPLSITVTGTPANPVVFKQSGNGQLPVLNFTGTSGSADAAFHLNSGSFFTFNGLDIRDAGKDMEYGFFLVGTATAGCQNNMVINCLVTLSNANENSTGIYLKSIATAISGTNSFNKFYNNTVQNCYNGYYISGNSLSPDDGNEIGTYASPATKAASTGTSLVNNIGGGTASAYGIWYQYEKNLRIFQTTISNVSSNSSSGNANGIYTINSPGGNSINVYIYNNNIFSILSRNGSTALALFNGSIQNVYNNIIHGVTASEGSSYGISASASTDNFHSNTIYDISYTGTTSLFSQAIGINLGIGGHNVYNNLVYDIRNTNGGSSGGLATVGIMCNGTEQHSNIFNNTVYLDYTSTSSVNMSACIYFTGTPNMITLNNNILVNKCNMSNGLRAIALSRQNSTLTNYALNSNNNCLYAGSPGPKNLIWYDGGNSFQTIEQFRAFADPRENQAFSENPPFISNAKPYDFHMQTAIPTQCESGGTTNTSPVSITIDHDSIPRYPNSGYPYNPSYPPIAPDMGAFEFGGLSIDNTPPDIQYTPLPNTGSLLPRTLLVTISDAKSNIPAGGIGLPVLYWRKTGTSLYTAVQAVSLGGSSYSFTFGGGVALYDIVSYYIVAQDGAAVPNVIAKPLNGTSIFTSNPPASSAAPSNPSTYTIRAGISDIKTVGTTGADYPTLTGEGGFFEDMNVKILTGNLTIRITSNLNEPGTYSLNQVLTDGTGDYSIKIVPADATEKLIQNVNDVPMIVFNGASHVILDGNYQGAGRYFRIRSTTAFNPSLVLQNDATFDTIRNCVFESGNGSTGGAVSISTSNQRVGNSYNVFTGNLFRDRSDVAAFPIYLVSATGTTGIENSANTFDSNDFINFKTAGLFVGGVGNGNNWKVTNNNFYKTASVTSVGHMEPLYFIPQASSSGNIISGNFIGGSAPHCGGSSFIDDAPNHVFYGIYAMTGTTTPTEIQGNTIKNIRMTGTGVSSSFHGIRATTGSYNIGTATGNMVGDTIVSSSVTIAGGGTCYGIYVSGTDNVSNNVIANITTTNATGLNLFHGIRLEGDFPITCERNRIVNIGPATGAANAGANNPLVGIYLRGATTMTNSYTVDNNLISLGGNGGIHNIEIDGMRVYQPVGTYNIYYNSINITGTAADGNTRGSFGIYKADASTVNCKDNIISNKRVNGAGGAGRHYALADISSSNLASDNNDVFSSSPSTTGLWGTTDCDFSTWKSLSAGDGHSVSVDPNYASNTDLHTQRSELNNAGMAIPDITTDFSGVLRGNPPDIGAYEFTALPANTSVQNIIVANGQTLCYNATQTITVAGNGTSFTINNGGSANMIAGQNIVYLPGTTVNSGGYMHGYITTTGQYCIPTLNPTVNNPEKTNHVSTPATEAAQNQNIRVYPNPAGNSFTMELTGMTGNGMTRAEIFGMNGIRVLSRDLAGERKHVFSIESLRPGIYFIHITTGSGMETVKLIKF